jgi:hypothetical protein
MLIVITSGSFFQEYLAKTCLSSEKFGETILAPIYPAQPFYAPF